MSALLVRVRSVSGERCCSDGPTEGYFLQTAAHPSPPPLPKERPSPPPPPPAPSADVSTSPRRPFPFLFFFFFLSPLPAIVIKRVNRRVGGASIRGGF